jgi:hypothetical protein
MNTEYPSIPSIPPHSDSAPILGPTVPIDTHSDLPPIEIEGDEIQDPDRCMRVVKTILAGATQLISFRGTSQYAGGGASACGLAALNCARCLLSVADEVTDSEVFLAKLISRQAVEVCMSQRRCVSLSSRRIMCIGDRVDMRFVVR